jgi:hypothetical protein
MLASGAIATGFNPRLDGQPAVTFEHEEFYNSPVIVRVTLAN